MNKNFFAGKIVGDKLYFSMMYVDALCCLDLSNMKYEVIKQFNIEGGIKIYHKTCHLYDNKLYFIPRESKDIYIYDMSTNNIDSISLPSNKISDPCDGVFYNNHLWIFPSMCDDDLIEVDLKSKRIEIIEDFKREINRKGVISDSSLLFHRIAQVDNTVWLPVFRSSKMVSYDLDKGKMGIYDVGETITGAFIGSDCLWLGTIEENRVLKWNYIEKCIEGVVQTTMSAIYRTGPSGIYEYGNYIIIVPGYGNEIHIVDILDGNDLIVYKMDDVLNENFPLFVRSELQNNKLYIFPYNDEKMIIIDLCECKASVFRLVSDEEMSKYISLKNNNEILLENDYITLMDFIGAITK